MRYQNNSHQTLKAAIGLSLIALACGFILNGASVTFTPNETQHTKLQTQIQHVTTVHLSQPPAQRTP